MNHIVAHPLILDKLTRMRDTKTQPQEFRALMQELTALMMYEVARDWPLKDVKIDTPLATMVGKALKNDLVVIPILRAGLGMVEGVRSVAPYAKIGHIGLYRNEQTLQPVEYYAKFPESIRTADVLILDPMLATGWSAAKAVELVKKHHPKSIRFLGLVGAPEGLNNLNRLHPDVDVYIAALDGQLNANGYITPGLGDAGDRLFGTK